MSEMTDTDDPPTLTEASGSGAAVARFRGLRSPLPGLARIAGGIGAVGVKELRGRMRGRRAFIILTIYLLLLGGFAWMVELIMERTYSFGFGGNGTYATASIGQGIFAALLMLETLQVAFLAPASTAGAISLEREKQTLELLVVTPITSLAIVLGKLLSALVYVWLLIAASIPLTAVVFLYGGVAPEDVLRGYLVLIVTALGLGSFGLFCSSLVKRTQAATAITIFGVLAMTIGSVFVLIFWQAMSPAQQFDRNGQLIETDRGRPPEAVVYLNPFFAQVDVLCGTETSFGGWCSIESSLLQTQNGVAFQGGPVQAPVPLIDPSGGKDGFVVAPDVAFAPADVQPFGVARDAFWPKSVIAWLVLSVAFILLTVQFVSPTRRWRLRRGGRDMVPAA
ncbi:MAG TPA: ABC transporter permease [Candidatus Limnocylindrales bacterium]|nr:ABC transporter permease [Candidatus Limnocylindrales bacterium]